MNLLMFILARCIWEKHLSFLKMTVNCFSLPPPLPKHSVNLEQCRGLMVVWELELCLTLHSMCFLWLASEYVWPHPGSHSVSSLKLQHSGDWKWNCLPGDRSVLCRPDNKKLLCTAGCCLLVRTVGRFAFLEGLGSSQAPFVMPFLPFLKTCVLLPPKLSLAVNRNISGITRAGQGPGSSHSSSLSEVNLLPWSLPDCTWFEDSV